MCTAQSTIPRIISESGHICSGRAISSQQAVKRNVRKMGFWSSGVQIPLRDYSQTLISRNLLGLQSYAAALDISAEVRESGVCVSRTFRKGNIVARAAR